MFRVRLIRLPVLIMIPRFRVSVLVWISVSGLCGVSVVSPLPSDREILRIISRPGAPWDEFAARFAAKVIARAQQIAVDRGVVSSNSRGKSEQIGDDNGNEYFKSFDVRLGRDHRIVFYNEAEHAKWIELGNAEGAIGGFIYPKRAEFLRFEVDGGEIVYARRVRAFKPFDVMRDATDDVLREMLR
jgi:hypothetical protein